MEFDAIVQGGRYRFALLNKTSFLITGDNVEYILYKMREWKCADDITPQLLEHFGEVIEDHLHLQH